MKIYFNTFFLVIKLGRKQSFPRRCSTQKAKLSIGSRERFNIFNARFNFPRVIDVRKIYELDVAANLSSDPNTVTVVVTQQGFSPYTTPIVLIVT